MPGFFGSDEARSSETPKNRTGDRSPTYDAAELVRALLDIESSMPASKAGARVSIDFTSLRSIWTVKEPPRGCFR